MHAAAAAAAAPGAACVGEAGSAAASGGDSVADTRGTLRAPALPPSWIAEPRSVGPGSNSAEAQLWRNQQKARVPLSHLYPHSGRTGAARVTWQVFDALRALQRDFPCATLDAAAGFGAGSRPTDFASAVHGVLAELRPANTPWFARLLTQRLLQGCLGLVSAGM